ncbi:hypothetical protein WA556_001787, partial [Blastocystis sp. ATCC 50177/Nand II]
MSIQVFNESKVVTSGRNKITSVTSDTTHIYVSLKDGKLFVYERIDGPGLQFRESGEIPNFSGCKKGAIMMHCVEKWNLLFALNDKGIAIHELNNLQNGSYLPNTSGCSLMAFDENRHVVVASWKRKIYVFQLRDQVPLNKCFVKEIILPDTVLCMEFLNSLLFVGYKREYCLVDINQGRSCKDICEISKSTSKPFCVRIQQGEGICNGNGDENDTKEQGEMLLANDRKGLFYDFVGSPARGKGQHLEWQTDAIGGAYLCPYFLALTTNGVEVFNSWRYQPIQTIPMSSPKYIEEAHFLSNGQSVDGCLVCTQQVVYVLQMLSLPQQITTLISDQYKCFDDALTLCSLFPRGKEQLRDQFKTQISRLKGLYLFSEGKYDSAISFLQRGMVPTQQVLSLYPSIIPDSLPTNISPYPQRVFQSRYEENQAIEALLPLLNTRRQQLLMKLSQLKSLQDKDNTDPDASGLGYSSVIHLSVAEEDTTQIWQDLTLIDTVLLRAYVRTNRPAIIPFLRHENFVPFDDAQQLLAGAGMEPELIALYSTHHKHDLAIAQILQPLRDTTLSPTERQQRLMDLVHYLQQLGSDYQELIFDCSRMFYKESRQLVLELFVNYHPVDGGQPIDCETIRQHLHDLSEGDEQLKNDWEKNALEITYLRHCIGDKNEGSPNFHTRLVLLYAQSISSLSASIQTLKKKCEEVETKEEDKEADYSSMLNGMSLMITQREELLLRSKKELLEFLELSDQYDITLILEKLSGNEFLEEQAIILSKSGEYLNALSIIAHRLGNINMADAYCTKIFNSGKNPDIFLHLIKTYLYPPKDSTLSKEDSIHLALRVFSSHFDKVDPIVVFNLLPDSLPLEEVMECIEVNLTKLDEKRRNMLMLRQLAEVRRLAVSEEYMNMRNSSFENTSTTICPVCKRVIGDSVFTWNPNGVIMHTACAIP